MTADTRQLAFNFADPALPAINAVLTDGAGRRWRVARIDTHINLFRADLPRPHGKTCPWSNRNGQALAWAIPTPGFAAAFA